MGAFRIAALYLKAFLPCALQRTGASVGGASVTGPESEAEILCRFLGLGASALVAPRPVPSSAAACCERGRVLRQQPPVISNVHAGCEEFSDGNAAWFHSGPAVL